MTEITINRESLAQRCEVCHQADCFDATQNRCSRCSELASKNNPVISYANSKSSANKLFLIVATLLGVEIAKPKADIAQNIFVMVTGFLGALSGFLGHYYIFGNIHSIVHVPALVSSLLFWPFAIVGLFIGVYGGAVISTTIMQLYKRLRK